MVGASMKRRRGRKGRLRADTLCRKGGNVAEARVLAGLQACRYTKLQLRRPFPPWHLSPYPGSFPQGGKRVRAKIELRRNVGRGTTGKGGRGRRRAGQPVRVELDEEAESVSTKA